MPVYVAKLEKQNSVREGLYRVWRSVRNGDRNVIVAHWIDAASVASGANEGAHLEEEPEDASRSAGASLRTFNLRRQNHVVYWRFARLPAAAVTI